MDTLFFKVIRNKVLFNKIVFFIQNNEIVFKDCSKYKIKNRIRYNRICSLEWMVLKKQYAILKDKLKSNHFICLGPPSHKHKSKNVIHKSLKLLIENCKDEQLVMQFFKCLKDSTVIQEQKDLILKCLIKNNSSLELIQQIGIVLELEIQIKHLKDSIKSSIDLEIVKFLFLKLNINHQLNNGNTYLQKFKKNVFNYAVSNRWTTQIKELIEFIMQHPNVLYENGVSVLSNSHFKMIPNDHLKILFYKNKFVGSHNLIDLSIFSSFQNSKSYLLRLQDINLNLYYQLLHSGDDNINTTHVEYNEEMEFELMKLITSDSNQILVYQSEFLIKYSNQLNELQESIVLGNYKNNESGLIEITIRSCSSVGLNLIKKTFGKLNLDKINTDVMIPYGPIQVCRVVDFFKNLNSSFTGIQSMVSKVFMSLFLSNECGINVETLSKLISFDSDFYDKQIKSYQIPLKDLNSVDYNKIKWYIDNLMIQNNYMGNFGKEESLLKKICSIDNQESIYFIVDNFNLFGGPFLPLPTIKMIKSVKEQTCLSEIKSSQLYFHLFEESILNCDLSTIIELVDSGVTDVTVFSSKNLMENDILNFDNNSIDEISNLFNYLKSINFINYSVFISMVIILSNSFKSQPNKFNELISRVSIDFGNYSGSIIGLLYYFISITNLKMIKIIFSNESIKLLNKSMIPVHDSIYSYNSNIFKMDSFFGEYKAKRYQLPKELIVESTKIIEIIDYLFKWIPIDLLPNFKSTFKYLYHRLVSSSGIDFFCLVSIHKLYKINNMEDTIENNLFNLFHYLEIKSNKFIKYVLSIEHIGSIFTNPFDERVYNCDVHKSNNNLPSLQYNLSDHLNEINGFNFNFIMENDFNTIYSMLRNYIIIQPKVKSKARDKELKLSGFGIDSDYFFNDIQFLLKINKTDLSCQLIKDWEKLEYGGFKFPFEKGYHDDLYTSEPNQEKFDKFISKLVQQLSIDQFKDLLENSKVSIYPITKLLNLTKTHYRFDLYDWLTNNIDK